MNRRNKYWSLFATLLMVASGNSYAAIPNGYYSGLEGLSGVSLKKAVKAAAKSHTAISYGDATWSVFLESDTHMINGQRCWWDMYSNNNVLAPNSSTHGGMNIEHAVANSWWGGTKNDAYKDLYHLNPSDADANNRKANYPLGIIQTQTWSNGVTFVGKPKNGDCGGASYVYEPADEYKGDFARAFFYMFTIYDDIAWRSDNGYGYMYEKSSDLLFKQWAYEMLLEWAKKDPVSQKEIDRNEAIYKHQKNRNPFIDYPELAEHIWGSKKNTPFHLDGTVTPDPEPDDPVDPKPDDPVTPTPDGGYWYAVTSSSDLNETDKYVVVSTKSNIAMSYKTGGSSSASYLHECSTQPGIDNSVSPIRISSLPSDVAVIKLTKNGAGWNMGIYDNNGNHKGFIQSSSTKNITLSSQPSTASITTSSASTTIKFGSVDGTLQYNYNDNGKRFTTYTTSLEPIMLYRYVEEKTTPDPVDPTPEDPVDPTPDNPDDPTPDNPDDPTPDNPDNPTPDNPDDPQGGTSGTGLDQNADELILGIFDVNGRKLNVTKIEDLDNGIYIVISNFGTKKIIK